MVTATGSTRCPLGEHWRGLLAGAPEVLPASGRSRAYSRPAMHLTRGLAGLARHGKIWRRYHFVALAPKKKYLPSPEILTG